VIRSAGRSALALLALVMAVLGTGLGPAPATASPAADDGVTVVTFTFDGTYKSQVMAAQILAANQMAGTFYVNSGYLDFPGYLSVDQLRSIARARNEVGGASLYGNNLAELSLGKAQRQVCDDRATLAQLGFQVTSFAYPYGDETAAWAKGTVRDCGYNSARAFAGLYGSATDCSSCPHAESLPPDDDFRIRTAPTRTRLAALQKLVTMAERDGGGWLPLVFTNVCVCIGIKGGSITPGEFSAFVEWLAARPGTTIVRTVDEVVGGSFKKVTGDPVQRLVPDPSAAISEPGTLSKAAAWNVFGFRIGQAQLLFGGIAISIIIVVTYRIASRGNRYVRH